MSNKIAIKYTAGLGTIFGIVWGPDRSYRWNGSAMVLGTTIADVDWADGAVSLTEILTDTTLTPTGQYTGDLPATGEDGEHQVDFYESSPDVGAVSFGFQAVDAVEHATTTAQDVAQSDLDIITGIDGVTLATLQTNYAPAKAADEMDLIADAVDSSAMAVSGVNEIQNGLATSVAQTTAQSDLDIITGIDGVTLATTQNNYAPSKEGNEMDLVTDAVDTASLAASAVTDIQTGLATLTNQTTILARLGAWTGSGVNTILGAFKALLSKAAATPSDIGGTFAPSDDSTEAIRDRGDAAWVTGSSGSTVPTVEEIDTQLTTSHGTGAWTTGSGGSGSAITVTPLSVTVSAGEVTDNRITVYQNAQFGPFIFVITDSNDDPVNLANRDLQFSVYDPDTPGTILWTLDRTGIGTGDTGDIDVSGDDANQVTVTDDNTNTGTSGIFRFILWDNTDTDAPIVRARGLLIIEPECDIA